MSTTDGRVCTLTTRKGIGVSGMEIAVLIFAIAFAVLVVALAVPILKAAAACLNGMATFAEAGVSGKA